MSSHDLQSYSAHITKVFISPAARHALLRLPENLRVLPLSQGLSSLVTATINREHAIVYDEASHLLRFVAQADFPDQELASITTSLLSAFIGMLTFEQKFCYPSKLLYFQRPSVFERLNCFPRPTLHSRYSWHAIILVGPRMGLSQVNDIQVGSTTTLTWRRT